MKTTKLTFGVATLALLLAACGPADEPDAPTVEAQLPYGQSVVVEDRLQMDIIAGGCHSGIQQIQILQAGGTVASFEDPADLAKTRFAVAVSGLSLRGLAYPAEVALTARVSCRSGAIIESKPVSVDLVPAQSRLGGDDARWPGYTFWVEASGDLLFCDGSQLVSRDMSGKELARSDQQLSCSSSTKLWFGTDRIVVFDGSTVFALGPSLRVAWQAAAQSAVVANGQVLLVKKTAEAPNASIALTSLSLSDGTTRWQTVLNGMGDQNNLLAPPVVSADGKVRILTLSTILSPLQGTYLAWSVDPSAPQAPSMTVLGNLAPMEPATGVEVLASPRGMLLPAGTAAVVAEYGAQNGAVKPARLRALNLENGKVLWENTLDADATFLPRGAGALVMVSDAVIEVGADGQVTKRFKAPAGAHLRQIHANVPEGVVLASLDLAGGSGVGMTLLDAALVPVWTVPFPSAFGAAADQKGQLFFLSNAMFKLFSPEAYRALTQN